VAIVWPCQLSVDQYTALGRNVEPPRADCPSCLVPMGRWSGYWRTVRCLEIDHRLFVPRARCPACNATHALLPAFVLAARLYDVETIGAVVAEVIDGPGGVRPAARRWGIVHETARGWVRRFRSRARHIASWFSALSADLGGEPLAPAQDSSAYALAAIGSAFSRAGDLAGWLVLGAWRFASAVTGGTLLATNTTSPYLFLGRRRFMPPVPKDEERKRRDGP
jgi:transposase-like protein